MFELEPVIGLEIHLQLKTKSKMFCFCPVKDGAEPNTLICPVCLGHPGTLPFLNKKAVEYAQLLCLALNCQINQKTKFDRKNYFYPDLPKGYQISQYDLPLGKDGYLVFISDGQEIKIGIERIHLEEDTAKLIHFPQENYTLIDFNRAGIPLLEIVSKPEIKTPSQAKKFLQELQLIARYLGISDAEMEKGQMRCDANISLRQKGSKELNPKTEIKNLNSFRAVERSLEYEIKRQKKLWLEKKPPKAPSTRGWDENKGQTFEQRVKEEISDYRYFPEPDIPPLEFSKKELEAIKKKRIPELPLEKRKRFKKEYELSFSDIEVLVSQNDLADYFEEVVTELKKRVPTLGELEGSEEEIWQLSKKKIIKLADAWIINRLRKILAEKGVKLKDCLVTPEKMADLIIVVYQNKINSPTAKSVLEKMVLEGKDVLSIIQEENLEQINQREDLEKIVEEIIKNNPQQVEEYKKGKVNLIQFFIGLVMKKTKGRAEPELVKNILKEKLEN